MKNMNFLLIMTHEFVLFKSPQEIRSGLAGKVVYWKRNSWHLLINYHSFVIIKYEVYIYPIILHRQVTFRLYLGRKDRREKLYMPQLCLPVKWCTTLSNTSLIHRNQEASNLLYVSLSTPTNEVGGHLTIQMNNLLPQHSGVLPTTNQTGKKKKKKI